MTTLLAPSQSVLLFGCGGGVLAAELYRRGCAVTLVDTNPIAFRVAREYFWMPGGIKCVVADMAEFLPTAGQFDGIGIDVGGPNFRYEDCLTATAIRLLSSVLSSGGRIALNIALDCAIDADPDRIALRLIEAHLLVDIFEQRRPINDNTVLFAQASEVGGARAAVLDGHWTSRRPVSRRADAANRK